MLRRLRRGGFSDGEGGEEETDACAIVAHFASLAAAARRPTGLVAFCGVLVVSDSRDAVGSPPAVVLRGELYFCYSDCGAP